MIIVYCWELEKFYFCGSKSGGTNLNVMPNNACEWILLINMKEWSKTGLRIVLYWHS